MRVLCVAEKPSIARSISSILADGPVRRRNGRNPKCPNFDVESTFQGSRCQMTITSVLGHLTAADFNSSFNKNWNATSPKDLFHAPVVHYIPQNMKDVAENLEIEAKKSTHLVIWTDCDREGEYIGFEVIETCMKANPNLLVRRSKFSVVQHREIRNAIASTVQLDQKLVEAVKARIELDLRIGSAFTRFQTLLLQPKFSLLEEKIISYGSCQFPTLGFIVEQYWKHEKFISESLWKINVVLKKNGISVPFNWSRHGLFDRHACLILYEYCVENPTATVTSLKSSPTKKWRPLPLTTIELQKVASSYLKMSSADTMKIAEKLYGNGCISYPRTDTDIYLPGFKLQELINLQRGHPEWGQFSAKLLDQNKFRWPRNGKNNDNAHPPIHPTKMVNNLTGNEKKIYDLIVRRFLACCADDAKGQSTNITISINSEIFSANGLQVLEENYLEIYKYERWSDKNLPSFKHNEKISPEVLEMIDGKTSPPTLLTESSLISTMNANGIGTDATIAEHIKKILDREYATKDGEYFCPTVLGLGLVEGYDKIAFDYSLAKPYLRKMMEEDMNAICNGTLTRSSVLDKGIQLYKKMYEMAHDKSCVLEERLRYYFNSTNSDHNENEPDRNSKKPRCSCNTYAQLKTVIKNGPNKGKKFWICQICEFFAWDTTASKSSKQRRGRRAKPK